MPPAKAPEQPKPKTDGWWNFRDKSGSIVGLCTAIDAEPTIPIRYKDMLKAELLDCQAQGFNFAYVDVHYILVAADEKQSPGKRILDMDITPDKKLL